MTVTRSKSAAARRGSESATGGRAARHPNHAKSAPLGALVFEMAGVLYDATPWRRELFKILVRLGVRASYEEMFSRWQQDYLIDVHRGFRCYEEAFHAFLLSTGVSWGQIDEIEAAVRVPRQELEAAARPLPGVAKTLSSLAQKGLPLAILANAPRTADKLAETLKRLRLADRFAVVLSSFDLEATKPAGQCYAAAEAALELPAEQLALVDCEPEHLAGAASQGWRTISLNAPRGARADAQLTCFAELVEVVERWTPAAMASGAL